MKKSDRYDTSGLIEGQYEPGSKGKVLKNLLKIKTKKQIESRETLAYVMLFQNVIRLYGKNHKFTAQDICDIHRLWLGQLYGWAGSYRQVNISKGGFAFAAARFIPDLMNAFEKEILSKYTPCTFKSPDKVLDALAVVHAELVLIHPFREGNGRLARLLADLMALQAGLPLLDFTHVHGKKKEEYFSAVRKSLDKDYLPMRKIFIEVIRTSLKSTSSKS